MTDLVPVPPSLTERKEYSEALAASDLLPKQYRGAPANVLVALEYGNALGLSPMAAIQGIHVVEGKPTASAQLIGALVRNAGHRLRVEGDNTHAVATIIRRDDPDFEFRAEWTIERAKQAGLAGKMVWKQYPAAMLKARCITEVARDACPEVLSGVAYTAEELDHAESQKVTVNTARLLPKTGPAMVSKEAKTRAEWVETDPETVEMMPVDVETGEIIDAEVLESVPETDENEPESELEDTEPRLTSDQSSRITRAIKAFKLGKIDTLALYAEVCGRAVPATWELTRVEAGLVLAHLETMTADDA